MKVKKILATSLLALTALAGVVATTSCGEVHNNPGTTEKATYTITFVTNNGTTLNSVSQEEGTSYTLPTNLTKTGYTFAGWYLASDFSGSAITSVTLTANTTVYAKWTINQYTLTYETNGAKAITAETKDYNTAITLPTNLTKTGYTFAGWYLTSDFSGSAITSVTLTSNVTVYAKWTINQYTLTYETNGATAIAGETKDYNSTITLPTPTKEGYTFNGWYLASDFTGDAVTSVTITSDTTVYAKWTRITFTVSFVTNQTSLTYDDVTVNSGEVVTLPAVHLVGYTFEGWYTDEALTQAFDAETVITSNITLYAKWSQTQTYTVTLEPNGGTLTTTTIVDNENATVTLPTPTLTGYTFEGWYSDSELTTKVESLTLTKDITLYAKYTINEYTLTYDVDGGTAISAVTQNYNTTVTLPTTAVKEGYTFNGWYLNESFTGDAVTSVTLTANTTVYAKFTINTYTITLVLNGGTLTTTSIEENYNTAVTLPTPTKEGYNFIAWYDSADFSGASYTQITLTEDVTLYAKYEEAAIDISSVVGGNETIYLYAEILSGYEATDYKVEYATGSTYTEVDSGLVRFVDTDSDGTNDYLRADIVGLPTSTYTVKVTVGNKTATKSNIFVAAQDRSGYAHFNYTSGVGAYNDDGSLKSNTVVIYVTNATKNTVTATLGGTVYTGLVNILVNLKKSSVPVCVRFLDVVQTTQWDTKTYTGYTAKSDGLKAAILADYGTATSTSGKYYASDLIAAGANSYSTDLANGITELENLTSWGSTTDSYWNMCDISSATNVTLEGIGDAGLYQWGITWSNCKSIEIKNLSFDDYTEDACAFQGNTDSATLSDYDNVGRHWVHNCTFYQGKNNWDVSDDQDKKEGDGAVDIKRTAYATYSYNHFIENHKTGLMGSDDTVYTTCVTYHHNYYENCQSRMPLGRNGIMHCYNNYYSGTTGTTMSIRARGYVYLENSVFENCKNPVETKAGSKTGFTNYTGAVKAYNNEFTSCTGTNDATIVTSRTEAVSNDNSYSQTFDTDSTIFYYDSTNQVTDVSILTETANVKEFVVAHAGNGSTYYQALDDGKEKFTVTFSQTINSTTTVLATKTVSSGNTVTAISAPSVTGYTFVGWYADSACTEEFDFTTEITANTTIYAKFEEASVEDYQIKFDSLSTGTLTSDTEVTNATIKATSAKTVSVASSSTTCGTTTVTNYIGLSGTGSTEYRSIYFTLNSTADITVYYKASASRYLGLYDSTGTLVGTSDATTNSLQSYTFSNVAAGNYYIYSTGSGINVYLINVEYAKVATTYDVNFVYVLNSTTTTISSTTVTSGQTVSQPTDPTLSGYVFGGWYTDSSCTEAFDFTTAITADTTIYAKWTEDTSNKYTVTFESNGGSFVTALEVTAGESVTQPTDPTKTNCTFGGWYDSTDTEFDFSTVINSNITLYANWTSTLDINMYTISAGSSTSAGNGTYVTNYVKTIYKAGDSFDSTYLTAVAGDSSIALADLTIDSSAFSSSTAGTYAINVSYKANGTLYSETYNVYVLSSSLSNLNVAVGQAYEVGGSTTINSTEYLTFATIEQGLEYLRQFVFPTSTNRASMVIAAGVYNEKLEIDVPYLTITGAGIVKATYESDESYSATDYAAATIIEWDSLFGVSENGFTNLTDSTQTVSVRDDAVGCIIKDLTISNWWNNDERFNNQYDYLSTVSYVNSNSETVYLASNSKVTEHRALALLVQADKFTMDGCSLLGYQDTLELFTGRQYFTDTYISGITDFIFGTNDTTYFYNCEIHCIYNGSTNGGYITAMRGYNKSESDALTYEVIFNSCNFTADSAITESNTSLGRPWGTYANVMIMNSTIGSFISTAASTGASQNERYVTMSGVAATLSTVKFYEYNNSGDGAISATQAGCTVITDSTVAANYSTFATIFGETNGYSSTWDPTSTTDNALIYFDFAGQGTTDGYAYAWDGSSTTIGDSSTCLATMSGSLYDNSNSMRMSSGATITFDVTAGTAVTIVSYSGYQSFFTINGFMTSNASQIIYFDTATTVTIAATATYYIKQIIINRASTLSASTEESITATGYTSEFAVGAEFSTGSIVVKKNYTDETYIKLTSSDYTVDSSNVDMSTAGTYTVTITASALQTTYDITVSASLDTSISTTTAITYKGGSYSATSATTTLNHNSDAKVSTSSGTTQTINNITYGNGAASNGEDNWLSFASGSTITFDVSAACTIYIYFYKGSNSTTVTLDGTEVTTSTSSSGATQNTAYEYQISAAGTVTITSTGNIYIGFIEIVF